jgi:hypothetical protein
MQGLCKHVSQSDSGQTATGLTPTVSEGGVTVANLMLFSETEICVL